MELNIFIMGQYWRLTEPDAYDPERQLQLAITDIQQRLMTPQLQQKLITELAKEPQFRQQLLKKINQVIGQMPINQLITKARYERQIKASNADELLQRVYSQERRKAARFIKEHYEVLKAEEDFNSRMRKLSGPQRSAFDFEHRITIKVDLKHRQRYSLKNDLYQLSRHSVDDQLIRRLARIFKSPAADDYFWRDAKQYGTVTPRDLNTLERFEWSDLKQSPEQFAQQHLADEWLDTHSLARFIARSFRGTPADGQKTIHLNFSDISEFISPVLTRLTQAELSSQGEYTLTNAISQQMLKHYRQKLTVIYDETITLQQLNNDLTLDTNDMLLYQSDLQVRQAVERLNKIIEKSKSIHYHDPYLIRKLGMLV